ncbi:MAG: hypothetical protein K0M66_15640 [Thiobacillus sp.]|nr:hypothetical protein [Thiobacillus sp.]
MFQLPNDFPLVAFVGRNVVDILEGAHFVQITFEPSDGGASVLLEGPVVLRSPSGEEMRMENEDIVVGNSFFKHLCTTQVSDVLRISAASCRFKFSNGWSLDLVGEKDGYESYHLLVNGESCDV